VTCNTNSDCNDGDLCTTGICNNPGQENSYCTQQVIVPNDCTTEQCGRSPSGCHTCGECDRLRTCENNLCVPRECDPKKENCLLDPYGAPLLE